MDGMDAAVYLKAWAWQSCRRGEERQVVSITFVGGNIGIVTDTTVGTVHTTTVHMIPIWLIVVILAVICIPIWTCNRGSRDEG